MSITRIENFFIKNINKNTKMSECKEYFISLLINRKIMLHLAIWVETVDGDSKCELPDLKDSNDYPIIFKSVNIDQDGNKIRMSGMFGNAIYQRINGEWIEIEYNKRDNSLIEKINPEILSWAN